MLIHLKAYRFNTSGASRLACVLAFFVLPGCSTAPTQQEADSAPSAAPVQAVTPEPAPPPAPVSPPAAPSASAPPAAPRTTPASKATPKPTPPANTAASAAEPPPKTAPATSPPLPTSQTWLAGCEKRTEAGGATQCDADALLMMPSAKIRVYTREPGLTRVTPEGYVIELRQGLPRRYRFFALP